jgi:hypothetical protein
MITLKITFYKNIKNVLILGGKKGGGGEFIVWTEFFSQQIRICFHKDIDD